MQTIPFQHPSQSKGQDISGLPALLPERSRFCNCVVAVAEITNDAGIDSVSLARLGHRGATSTQIAGSLPAVGTFAWTVPENTGSLLTVRVHAEETAGNSADASRFLRVSSSLSGSYGKIVNTTAIRDSIDTPSSIRDRTFAGNPSQGISFVAIPTNVLDPDETVSRFRGAGNSRSSII